MNDDNFLETLASSLNQSASVKNVFGEPIRAGDKIIIPVAQVSLGMGGGFGRRQTKKRLPPDPSQPILSDKPETPAGGGGGGGGMHTVALGVYEVTPMVTRFIPAYDIKAILISLATGFLLGRLAVAKLLRKR